MSTTITRGYDVIGDIHGCAAELEALLDVMDYERSSDGVYWHPNRRAVFVGDLIDRGPDQLRVLRIVNAMVDAGSAHMVLGNHEFNALAYATEWLAGSGKYLRPHDDPGNEKAAKNEKQHAEFLAQVTGSDREHYLKWFWKQPLWLDLGGLRVVHACWHPDSINYIESELGGDRFTDVDQLVRACDEDSPLYTAVENLLKGPEISLVGHGQEPYLDKDGHIREQARLRWWHDGQATLRHLAEMGGGYHTHAGDLYPPLPYIEVSADHQRHLYTEQVPVIYGHYWRQGMPDQGHDWTDYTACVDFSAVKEGTLTAYRWSGEPCIRPEHYVSVPAQVA